MRATWQLSPTWNKSLCDLDPNRITTIDLVYMYQGYQIQLKMVSHQSIYKWILDQNFWTPLSRKRCWHHISSRLGLSTPNASMMDNPNEHFLGLKKNQRLSTVNLSPMISSLRLLKSNSSRHWFKVFVSFKSILSCNSWRLVTPLFFIHRKLRILLIEPSHSFVSWFQVHHKTSTK